MKKIILPVVIAISFGLSANAQIEKCGTAEMLEKWQSQDHLSRSMWAVPVLTGTELIYSTAHFEIHYTVTGGDAVANTDVNGNFVPDIVDTAATKAEISYANFIGRGYVAPPGAAIGNTMLYDIFMLDIPTHYGVSWYGATLVFDSIGDNPNTIEPETHSATSFLVLRNEYTVFTPTANPSVDIEVTVAHEFSHSIDFGYSYFISSWFTEARSTFEESNVFPEDTDNFQYLRQIISTSDIALNIDRKDNGGNIHPHEYGAWLFNRYVAEHVSAEFLKPVLESARTKPNNWASTDIEALNNTLIYDHETTLREQYNNFCVANWFLTSDTDYAPYSYQHGNEYFASLQHRVLLEDLFNYTGTDIYWNSVADGNSVLQRMSADYFVIHAAGKYSIRLKPSDDDSSFNLIVMKVRDADKHYEFAQAGYSSDGSFVANVFDYDHFDRVIVIVIRYDHFDTLLTNKQYDFSIEQPLPFLNWWIPHIPFATLPTALAVDKSNRLWVGAGFSNVTHNGYGVLGIVRYNGLGWHHYHYYNSLRAPGTNSFPNVIMDIDVAPNNHIWFGEANTGLFEYDYHWWKNWDDGDNNPNTFYGAFSVDAQTSNVWCAPRDYHLVELSGGLPTNQGTYNEATTFVKLQNGKKLVGTSGAGLYVEDGGNTMVYDTSNGLPSMYITDAEYDHDGNLWVGTWGGGLGMFDGTTWHKFDPWNTPGSFVATRVADIAIAENGIVWFAYDNDGFGRYKNGNFMFYDYVTAPLFPANKVFNIDFDKNNGCLWMATDHGIVYYCDTADEAAPVAVNEIRNRPADIILFPNPANDIISIYASGDVFAEKTVVNFFDVDGRMVKSLNSNFSTNMLQANICDLMKGVYLVEVNGVRTKLVKL